MTREEGIRLVERLNREAGIPSWDEILHPRTHQPIVEQMLSRKSPFCTSLVACGLLSQQQMEQAALRYRLGESRFNWTVFWQIDEQGKTVEGRCVYYQDNCEPEPDCAPQWVTDVLFLQCGLPRMFPVTTCLFGLHLLSDENFRDLSKDDRMNKTPQHTGKPIIAVTRLEKTAVILSERLPGFLWMAVGDDRFLRPELFYPLRGHRLIVFPERPAGSVEFARWQRVCQIAGRRMGQHIRISASPLFTSTDYIDESHVQVRAR